MSTAVPYSHMQIARCSDCGNKPEPRGEPVIYPSGTRFRAPWYFECPGCGARAGESGSYPGAVRNWNIRQ